MANYAYVGETAYELIYKQDDPPLTPAQAEALAAEYSKLGLPWKSCTWNGYNCVIAKAPPEVFSQFCLKRRSEWEAIRDRVGYNGLTDALNNRYEPGRTVPDMNLLSGPRWKAVVAFIDANYGGGHSANSARPRKESAARSPETGCFIATACYGSKDSLEVKILRSFRDARLNVSHFGRALINLYYSLSPTIALWLKRHPRIAAVVRKYLLDPIVNSILRSGRCVHAECVSANCVLAKSQENPRKPVRKDYL